MTIDEKPERRSGPRRKEDRLIENERKRTVKYWLALAGVIFAGGIVNTILWDRVNDTADETKILVERVNSTSQETKSLVEKSEKERQERAHQTCTLFERNHADDVKRLTATYKYLLGLNNQQRLEPLNQAVLAGLSETEAKVRTDIAPVYCDKPGEKAEKLWKKTKGKEGKPPVGLPEPNPKIPERPKGI
jgi:hypothetical protein